MSLEKLYHKFGAIILYGVVMAAMIFVLKWLQWKFLITDNSIEIYIGLIAIFFSALGVWIATQLVKYRTQTVTIEKEVYPTLSINETELKKLNLSNREYDVLLLITCGHTNAEIAENYFCPLVP
jgi:two-component system, NarL family, response regulator LiaR